MGPSGRGIIQHTNVMKRLSGQGPSGSPLGPIEASTAGMCLNLSFVWLPLLTLGRPTPSDTFCGPPPLHHPVGASHRLPGGPTPLTATVLQQRRLPWLPWGRQLTNAQIRPRADLALNRAQPQLLLQASVLPSRLSSSSHSAAPSHLLDSLVLRGRPPPAPRPLPSSAVQAHCSTGPERVRHQARPRLVLRGPPLCTGAALNGPDAPTGAPPGSHRIICFPPIPRGRQIKTGPRRSEFTPGPPYLLVRPRPLPLS
ncbi:hypothetical protein NDU88_005882 [Pleurodeles waltl]|uniref:Uncharacterized protein n=1 Tax=Pleurodeles waltl TaxID=8319 RepID=A0AAV7MYU3_PLEWA|nr:hypothetical protein NDU88_005882 [Pleurodeles waltl]